MQGGMSEGCRVPTARTLYTSTGSLHLNMKHLSCESSESNDKNPCIRYTWMSCPAKTFYCQNEREYLNEKRWLIVHINVTVFDAGENIM